MNERDISFTLDWVANFLEEGGRSKAEIMLARKRGRELLTQQDVNSSESVRFVLDHIKDEYSITFPVLEKDQQSTAKGALTHIKDIKNPVVRTKGLKAFFGFKSKHEGD